jgi:hypothetical protein
MKKSVSRILYLLAIVIDIVAITVFYQGAGGGDMAKFNALAAAGHLFVAADMSNSSMTATGALLFLIAFLLAIVAFVGALVKTARLRRWGWFICLLLFSGITMLIYIFAGPTTRKS